MSRRIHRRAFLRGLAGGAAGLTILGGGASARAAKANDRLNVALIGVGGRGTWFVDTMPRMVNVVAVCDVNTIKIDEARARWADLGRRFAVSQHDWERNAAPTFQRLADSKVKAFADFRRMLDEMGKEIDAVVVATPDHTHAVASAAAIKAGKHVLCEKPLTRAVGESRTLRELARKHKVATSMGNQGTAAGPFRRALELIRDGTLGEIRQVHIWNTGGGSDKPEPPKGDRPVPANLNWDLWLGPAAVRPFHPEWLQRNAWRDFGTCQLGNWASHTANLAFMALKVHELWLGDWPRDGHPILCVQAKCSGINKLSFPKWEIIDWEIPARAGLPPITFHWYNGASAPGARELIVPLTLEGVEAEAARKEPKPLEFAGALILGTKGRIHTTGHNATFRLLPADVYRDVATDKPLQVESSRGHEMDWVLACKGGKPAWASFDYAAALNEFLMLGNVATQFEGKLEFDPVDCRILNNADADRLLRPEYRQGWSL